MGKAKENCNKPTQMELSFSLAFVHNICIFLKSVLKSHSCYNSNQSLQKNEWGQRLLFLSLILFSQDSIAHWL